MGTGPENSVTNSYGQTHEIPNLWMAGPCIFPSEGASNPTYTIFSVSLRGAEHLAQNWGDGRGLGHGALSFRGAASAALRIASPMIVAGPLDPTRFAHLIWAPRHLSPRAGRGRIAEQSG